MYYLPVPSPERLVDSIRTLSERIHELERDLQYAKAKLEGLNEALSYCEADASIVPRVRRGRPQKGLKPGSISYRAREVLMKAGVPLYITDLLERMGEANTKQNRTSIASTLRQYIRAGEYFTLPSPNTFAVGPAPVDPRNAGKNGKPPKERKLDLNELSLLEDAA